jgi:predicted phage terminase large subunit-like protein
LLRRSFAALALPSGLMDRAAAWLSGTAAKWESTERLWRFPSGAVLSFGYLDSSADRYRYNSSEYQFIGFDELTEFREQDYLFLFSRLRRLKNSPIPLRMRSASNPGNLGHAWVKRRFNLPEGGVPGRAYVRALLTDNDHLDQDQYRRSLENLPAFERKQLEEGSWETFAGNVFHPHLWPRWNDGGHFIELLPAAPGAPYRRVQKEDLLFFLAVDPATSSSTSADYTVILVLAMCPGGELLLMDCFRQQIDAGLVVEAIARVCAVWHPSFAALEAVGFARLLTTEAARHPGIPPVRQMRPQGKGKLHRSIPAVVAAEQGRIYLPDHDPLWLDDVCTELAAFTGQGDDHDDVPDALSYAVLAMLGCPRIGSVHNAPAVLVPGRRDPFGPGDFNSPPPTDVLAVHTSYGAALYGRGPCYEGMFQAASGHYDYLTGWERGGGTAYVS